MISPSRLLQFFCIVGCLFATSKVSIAQVTSDGTVNTLVNTNGNTAEITGGETRGSNLFHSFQDFSVPTRNEAFFNNANDIANIFSRVTGNNISNIDGLIRANGSASLFLINPAGIIFGENARLDLGGSFYGSTASSILFEDEEFSAIAPENSLLTVNAPIGLGLRDNPGDIVNRSTSNSAGLSVSEGKTISLVGGNVTIDNGGIVFAPGGIELGGLIEAGTINIANDGSLDFPNEPARGNVSLIDSSIVAVSSDGSIGINAANLKLFSGSQLIGGIRADSPDVQAGDIAINTTDSIVIDGLEENNTGIYTNGSNVGNAGNIEINTGSLWVNNGALHTDSSAGGRGGDITINAVENVSFSNNSNIFTAGVESGSIQLNARNLSITSGSNFSAGVFTNSDLSAARSGNIDINLQEDLVIDGLDSDSLTSISNAGDGINTPGNIDINARNITFQNGGNIGIFGLENLDSIRVGNITLKARGNILFDGIKSFSSGIVNNLPENSSGSIGEINVTAQNLTIANGARINSLVGGTGDSGDINLDVANSIKVDGFSESSTEATSTVVPSNISSNVFTNTTGNAGSININTQNLELSRNGSINAQLLGRGNSGNININAKQITIGEQGNLNLSPSNINAQNFGEGNAGNITINTNSLLINDGGNINVGIGGMGNGGKIEINARDTVSVDGAGVTFSTFEAQNIEVYSAISANTLNSVGNAGNIEIEASKLLVTNGANISADILGDSTGNGGSIIIQASDLVKLSGNGSFIAADIVNANGNAGNIEIDTGKLSITDGGFITTNILSNSTIANNSNGDGGSIAIRASDSVEVSNGGIEADVLENTSGNGGNLTIETSKLIVNDGSQISATTFGAGNAGNLTIRAVDSVELSGYLESGRSGLFASAIIGSGDGGNIDISTNNLTISDGAAITASNFSSSGEANGGASTGTGEPGNIEIIANSLNLDSGRIEAATRSQNGAGANINLQVEENITLQSNSFISARAFDGGNGGNLTIDTDFIIAFPDGNNDIIAIAQQGKGGNIIINAESLLGIKKRPLNSQTNDINASSEVTDLDGTVNITILDLNPIEGAIELPTYIVEPVTTTAQACQATRQAAAKNSLTIAGSGVPVEPGLPLNSVKIFVGDETSPRATIVKPIGSNIQPARGVVVKDRQVALTTYPTNSSGDRLLSGKINCGV